MEGRCGVQAPGAWEGRSGGEQLQGEVALGPLPVEWGRDGALGSVAGGLGH